MNNAKCKICGDGKVEAWGENYWHCEKCEYVWLDEEYRVSPEVEKERYSQHENTMDNEGYVGMFENFLRKIGNISNKNVLDFGCGKNPVLAKIMLDKGVKVSIYDKYFYPKNDYTKGKYDIITMTEVFEHLWEPVGVLQELEVYLNEGGKIAIMTKLRVGNESDFQNWWYRRDITHVGFLAKESIKYLAEKTNMKVIYVGDGVIILEK